MAFGMDYEKILRRHVLEEELRGGTDAVKDADLKLTAPPVKPQNKTNTTKLWWDAIMNDRSVAAAGLVRQRNVDVNARDGCGRTEDQQQSRVLHRMHVAEGSPRSVLRSGW